MTCSQALLSVFLLGPCGDGGGDSEAITAALASPMRAEADVARDAGRKPDEILAFFGIEPGMKVLEVFAGGGYYTQILDSVVGKNGGVIAHNNQAYLAYIGPQFEARFDNGSLPNTERVIAEANDIALEEGSLDAALMILTYHDFLFGSEDFGWQDVDEKAFLNKLCGAMKPGAVLGVIDHVADAGGDPTEVAFGLHRVDPAQVRSDLTGSCFGFDGENDLLRNPEDDHTTSATQGPLQGRTDRFVFKFTRR